MMTRQCDRCGTLCNLGEMHGVGGEIVCEKCYKAMGGET